MESLSYAQYSLGLQEKLVQARVPLNGTIEVTHRCPLTCSHCYNNLPMSDTEAKHGELGMDEYRRIIDEIVDAGCLWLLFTGGEIFARADFLDIYTYAKQKGLLITLFTNGTMVTPKIADYLTEWQPFRIEITLYGRTRETYERLTGIPGSYDRCLRGIHLLKERGLPLVLKTVAVSVNQHEIWEMKRFVEEDLELEFKFDAMMSPRIDCSQSPLSVRLAPEQIVSLDLGDPRRVSEWQTFARQYIRPGQTKTNDELYTCGGGVNSFAIDPAGRMSICVLSHCDTYDLRSGSFLQGWKDFLLTVRLKKATRQTKCASCQIQAMCGMCPANGELEAGDPESPVDFLCHVAHLRAHAIGLAVPAHGECEYCEGGERYLQLLDSADRLAQGIPPPQPANPTDGPLFQILGELESSSSPGCSLGGCTSCTF